jgi:dTDP-4-dehydrorhamnose reductase
MRTLVTGVAGQVGGALVNALREQVAIIAADRTRLDLGRPLEIASALDRIEPELIVNAAAYTAVNRAEADRDQAFRINADAPGAIAQWAAGRRVPLIHFSTDYVYDGTGDRPWREDDPASPLSVYGASKLAGELAIRAAGGRHLIIRTQWVYAAAGVNFLRTIVRLASERKELRIVADQYGAPTSARLIADVVATMIQSRPVPLTSRIHQSGGLINVAASGETSWHGFTIAIVKGLRARGINLAVETILPISTAEYPTKARRPANSRLDLTRLGEVFGITTPKWEVALATELDRLASELTHSERSGVTRCHNGPIWRRAKATS